MGNYKKLELIKCVVVAHGVSPNAYIVRILGTDDKAHLICGEPLAIEEEVTCFVGNGEPPDIILGITIEERKRLQSRPQA